MFEKIQVYLVKYGFFRILVVSAAGILTVWVLVGCNQTRDNPIPDRVQHPFDECINNSEIVKCEVLVRIER